MRLMRAAAIHGARKEKKVSFFTSSYRQLFFYKEQCYAGQKLFARK
jgi:hypothetical protein